MLTKNFPINFLFVFIVFFFVNCNKSTKHTITSKSKNKKITLKLKTTLKQNKMKQVVSELTAFVDNKNNKFKYYTDFYKRKWKIDKNGYLIIPSEITYNMLMPPSSNTLAIDASIASRLYNDKYYLTATRQFVSILEMPTNVLNSQTVKIKKQIDSYFCKQWKKIEKNGGNWNLMLKKIGITSHKVKKSVFYYNHINKIRFSLSKYYPVFMRNPSKNISLIGFLINKHQQLTIITRPTNTTKTLEQILHINAISWEKIQKDLFKTQIMFKQKQVTVLKKDLYLGNYVVSILFFGEQKKSKSFIEKISKTFSLFKIFPVCTKMSLKPISMFPFSSSSFTISEVI